jgi:adenine phosphoribosyltransferase
MIAINRLHQVVQKFITSHELNHEEIKQISELHQRCSIDAPWSNPKLFQKIVTSISYPFLKERIDKVISIDSRGHLIASAVAYKLKAGLVPIHKSSTNLGKIFQTRLISQEFVDYSNQSKALTIEDNPMLISKNDRLLIIDDWFASGNHAKAVIALIKHINRGKIIGFGVVFNSLTSKSEAFFRKKYLFHSLINYQQPTQTNIV